MHWPPEPGDYEVGNPKKRVAVCTLDDDIELSKNRIAIYGKNRTENLGIERIVVNLISNNSIRYLIVCGSEIKGHRPGQTLVSLSSYGVDKRKKVIKTEGAIPILQNIPGSFVERFRKQIKVVNMIGVTNERIILKKVNELDKKKTKPFQGQIGIKRQLIKPEIVLSRSIAKEEILISPEHNLLLDPETGQIKL